MSDSHTDALRLEDVAVTMGEREVLSGCDLTVRPGELVALVGRNGAGKTTLLRVASRVLAPDRGRVEIFGRDANALSRRDLAREIAVVPQDAPVAFPFRVSEIVLMGRSPHLGPLGFEAESDLARAREAMARVGIDGLADRSIQELSGGERQLALFARALTQDPRMLLLDEPTAHLDLRHRIEILELVREFARGGRAALVVSHDLALAARFCHRAALLGGGRVVAVGAPGEVLTRERLREVFGVEADVWTAPDGAPLVVPRLRLR